MDFFFFFDNWSSVYQRIRSYGNDKMSYYVLMKYGEIQIRNSIVITLVLRQSLCSQFPAHLLFSSNCCDVCLPNQAAAQIDRPTSSHTTYSEQR